ncbi:hypothetical protein AB4Y44_14200 [Paraburkholderia sp. BR10937]|uniref:hypothetical protein n=1 Tax=Paraburkholderia sp. BR10937 TaxID=3236994 RepID=UPI0034D354B1
MLEDAQEAPTSAYAYPLLMNLYTAPSFELATGMRCESPDFIEARSRVTGCNKA